MTEEYWLELAAEVLTNTALTTRFSNGHSACAALPDIRRATGFAAWKHTGQCRKGEGKTPYIHHPIEVAAILSEAGAIEDNDLLQAALLHDTIEDTQTEREEIESHFGSRICSIVVEVTDDNSRTSTGPLKWSPDCEAAMRRLRRCLMSRSRDRESL